MRILYLFACLWGISLLGFLGGNYSISKMKKNRMHFCIDWCIDWLHEERVGRLFEAKIPALITHFSKVRLKIDANSPTLSNTFFIILVISMPFLLLSSRFIVSEWTAWRTDWFTWWDALRTEVYGSARMENQSTRYNCSTAYRKSITSLYWKKTSVKCK